MKKAFVMALMTVFPQIWDGPAILDINTENVEGWPYKSSGHFVNVSGYKKAELDVKEIRIIDPYGPGLGNCWYPIDMLYQANENHFRQAFIW